MRVSSISWSVEIFVLHFSLLLLYIDLHATKFSLKMLSKLSFNYFTSASGGKDAQERCRLKTCDPNYRDANSHGSNITWPLCVLKYGHNYRSQLVQITGGHKETGLFKELLNHNEQLQWTKLHWITGTCVLFHEVMLLKITAEFFLATVNDTVKQWPEHLQLL